MRPGVPWSIKGIEPEARETAKIAAQQHGLTLGAWLNRLILENGVEENGNGNGPARKSSPPRNQNNGTSDTTIAQLTEVLKGLIRPEALVNAPSEGNAPNAELAPITDSVHQLVGRIEDIERHNTEAIAQMSRSLAEIAQRVEDRRDEIGDPSDRSSRRESRSLHNLERTVDQLLGKIESTEQQNTTAVRALEQSLNTITARIENLNGRDHAQGSPLSPDSRDMRDLKRDISDIDHRLQTTEKNTLDALQRMEQAVSGFLRGLDNLKNESTQRAEVAATNAAKRAVNELSHTGGQPQAFDGLQSDLQALAGRVTASQARQDGLIKEVRETVSELTQEINARRRGSRRDTTPGLHESPLGSLTSSLDELHARLRAYEEKSEAVEEEVKGLTSNLLTADERQQRTLEEVQSTLRQVEDRLRRTGKESPPLPPIDIEAKADWEDQGDNKPSGPPPVEAREPTRSPPPPPPPIIEREPQDKRADQPADGNFLDAARRAARTANSRQPREDQGTPVIPGVRERFNRTDDRGSDFQRIFVMGASAFIFILMLIGAAAWFLQADDDGFGISDNPPPRIAPAQPSSQSGALPQLDGPSTATRVTQSPPERLTASTGTEMDTPSKRISIPEAGTKQPASAALTPSHPSQRASDPGVRITQAATSGDPLAQYEVGLKHLNGAGVPKDVERAAYWVGLSAAQGYAPAEYRQGTFFEKGLGVGQDKPQAFTWYERAASRGNRKAMHNLAVMYAEGEGIDRDFSQAARWFRSAANLGLPDSQFNLAILYERGLGGEKNLIEAYKWFGIAARHGDMDAAKYQRNIEKRLSVAEANRLRDEIAKWRPGRLDPLANGQIRFADTPAISATAAASEPKSTAFVLRAQRLLNALGYSVGTPDGMLGAKTREAIRAFEMDHGRAVTGKMNPWLVDDLEQAAAS